MLKIESCRSIHMMKHILLVCALVVSVLFGGGYGTKAAAAVTHTPLVAALSLSRNTDDTTDTKDIQSQVTLNAEKIQANKLSTDADIQEVQGELRSVRNILKVFFVGILVSLCLNIALVYYIKRHKL